MPKAGQLTHLAENSQLSGFELSAAQLSELGDLNEHWSALGPALQYLS